MKIKGELTRELTDHWSDLLAKKVALDDNLTADQEEEVPIAGIEADANKVTFSETEIDLIKISAPDLAKAVDTFTAADAGRGGCAGCER